MGGGIRCFVMITAGVSLHVCGSRLTNDRVLYRLSGS